MYPWYNLDLLLVCHADIAYNTNACHGCFAKVSFAVPHNLCYFHVISILYPRYLFWRNKWDASPILIVSPWFNPVLAFISLLFHSDKRIIIIIIRKNKHVILTHTCYLYPHMLFTQAHVFFFSNFIFIFSFCFPKDVF